MKFFCFLSIWLLFSLFAYAQSPKITEIEKSSIEKDSSYYHIFQVDENNFWAIGKYGIIKNVTVEGKLQHIDYPTTGNNLLNMEQFSKDHWIICGDKGFIYHYFPAEDKWKVQQLNDYKKKCFYSICKIDKKTAFICGGNSKIANSQRVVPNGFVLKTTDGGKTWKRVHKSSFSMAWSIKYNSLNGKIYLLVYTPVKSKILSSADTGKTWKKEGKKFKGLFHDFHLTDNELLMAGGNNGNYGKNGVIYSNGTINYHTGYGLFWDIDNLKNHTLASGTNGKLAYKSKDGDWEFMDTSFKNHLYEIAFIDGRSAFIVGSQKRILKVIFED